MREKKPAIVNQHNVVYQFKCGLCTSSYIGNTCRHVPTRIDEDEQQLSSTQLLWLLHLEPDDGVC